MLFIAAIHFFALNVSGSSFCWVGAVAFRKCYLPLKRRLKELKSMQKIYAILCIIVQ
ncbi:putative membrane protein [Escherichia phage 434]|nr:putative membrane protein [Escherichia phage 434]UMO75375.1 putative membrane protein [Escherichia phage 434]